MEGDYNFVSNLPNRPSKVDYADNDTIYNNDLTWELSVDGARYTIVLNNQNTKFARKHLWLKRLESKVEGYEATNTKTVKNKLYKRWQHRQNSDDRHIAKYGSYTEKNTVINCKGDITTYEGIDERTAAVQIVRCIVRTLTKDGRMPTPGLKTRDFMVDVDKK